MIDGRGCLWVTDFGLACCQGDPGLTGTGELPGTLRYMSSEQALGPRSIVDHRTDVYGLGVTLYELLTLEPACPGGRRQEVLSWIANEETRPPRRLNRSIPRDLETIVLKASAKHAGDRYATAGELAEDLRRFLDDRPILAQRLSPAERLKRWLRRHRAVAWSAAAVVVVAVAALVAGTVVVVRQRDKFREGERQARQVVDRMYTDFAENWLAQQPYLEPVQRDYLQSALEHYERLMRQGDSGGQLAACQAARRVGDIRQRCGEPDRAEEAYARAQELLEALKTGPEAIAARAELAVIGNHLGNLLRQCGRFEEARLAYQEARTAFAALADEAPAEPAYRDGLAGSWNNLGMVEHNLGRPREAELAYREALPLLRKLVAEHPQQPAYRHDLASCSHNFGSLLHDLERLPEAEKFYVAALAVWGKLLVEYPGAATCRPAEANCLQNLATLRASSGRLKQAEQTYREAIARRARLAEHYPQARAYRQGLAASHHALGVLLAEGGQFSLGEKLQQAAYLVHKGLATSFPDVAEHQRALAASHQGFAHLLAAKGRVRQAEEAARAALAVRSRLASRAARGSALALVDQRELAAAQHFLGQLLLQAGRAGESEKLYRQGIAALAQLSPGPMRRSEWVVQRASLSCDLGTLLGATGRSAEAEKAFRHALTLLDEAVPAQGEAPSPEAREVLAEALDRLGALLHKRGAPEEAAKCFDRAGKQRAGLAKKHPDVAAFHAGLAWFLATCPDSHFRDGAGAVAHARKACQLAPEAGLAWGRLGVACYRAGDRAGAIEALSKAVELRHGGDRTEWLFLAMSHWRQRNESEARRWHNRALARLGKDVPAEEEVRRFQAEAAALIPQELARPSGGRSASDDR
jgi:tetratricopeptide (TPR) repeat protein